MAPASVLVIQLRQLGDILLTTPCLRELKQAWPECRLTFFSHKMGRAIVKDNPYVDEHIVYDDQEGFWKLTKLALELRKRRFDIVIDFMNNPRSAIYTAVSGAKQRLSYQSARWWAYNRLAPRTSGQDYIVREKFQLLEFIDIEPKNEGLTFVWGHGDLGPVKQLVDDFPDFANSSFRVLLSPTHRRLRRKWPDKEYIQLADMLVKDWGASVVWLWGPGEKEEVAAMVEQCQQTSHLAPATTLAEMAALMANSDLFVGNSNGPSHIAVATDLCSLQLHGSTFAHSWCPMNLRHRAVQSPKPNDDAPMLAIDQVMVKGTLEAWRPMLEAEAQLRKNQPMRTQWKEPKVDYRKFLNLL
jgi:ADP-heptose:LPS heptosyltransferase